MKLTLQVNLKNQYGHWCGAIDIPDLYRRCFEPLKTCDDPLIAWMSGDVMKHGVEAKIVMKTREDAAEILAKELADFIVTAMKKDDTHNGYRKED